MTKKPADILFDCQLEENSARCEIDEKLEALGVVADWFVDWIVDFYDKSIEFRPIDPSFELSEEVREYLSEVGFHLCWIQYPDGKTKTIKLIQ